MNSLDPLLTQMEQLKTTQRRSLIAVAGPPAAGKSTLSEAVQQRFGMDVKILPMDGFHLDNAMLESRGHLHRKGAPFTFDVAQFAQIVAQIAQGQEVMAPTFDRTRDCVVPNAERISAATPLIVVEGNYLLLDEPQWADLAQYWDLSVFLDVPMDVLEARLIARWVAHNHTEDEARARALGNDIPNARTVLTQSRAADITLRL